jgi:hypothetical protein
MEQLKALFKETGLIEYAIKAQKLRKYMSKPYRVQVRIKEHCIEYSLSPLIPIQQIERLVQTLNPCENAIIADQVIDSFLKQSHIK